MKIRQIPHVIFQTTSQFFFLFRSNVYTLCTKGTNQSANFLDFGVLGFSFTKFLSLLKQQIGFSSNLASLFSIIDTYNSAVLFFSWNCIYFQQKEPIKVQIWWNFTWPVKSLKFCTLMDSFCKNHKKFQLKKYRRVISHDIEEWCKV